MKKHLVLLYALAVSLFVLAHGCTGPSARRVISTTRLEYGVSNGSYEDRCGDSRDTESQYVGISIEPFAALAPPAPVYIANSMADRGDATEPAPVPSGGKAVASTWSGFEKVGGSGTAPTSAPDVAHLPPGAAGGGHCLLTALAVLLIGMGVGWGTYVTWPYWGGRLWNRLGRALQRRKPGWKAKR